MIKLSDIDTRADSGFSKKQAKALCKKNAKVIDDLSYRLDAEGKRSLLIVLQGMDAAGKDGAIRHFIKSLSPQSCTVTSFKQPTAEEAGHDFLWRVHKCMPQHGKMAIFNRSHYEDVLIVRVHKMLDWTKGQWKDRYIQINDFERLLALSGTTIIKFFLHISKEEQHKRLQARLDDPCRRWKFSKLDLAERKLWDEYQNVYEEAINHTSTDFAPWTIVPADRKWHRDLMVSNVLRKVLERMNPKFPDPDPDLDGLKVE